MKQRTLFLALLGLMCSAAQAQSVIFQVSGRAFARDYFGGAGIVENFIPATVGTNFSILQSALAGGASSAASAVATGNSMTTQLSTVAQSGFGSGFNFFIFDARAELFVDTYILGAPGTPYSISINGTGFTQVTDAGTGSNANGAGTVGTNDPGWLFTWGTSGGTFTQTGLSDSTTLLYGGNLYSRVRPLPQSSAQSFFGITGSPGFSGTGYYETSHTVTTTVNNLGPSSAAPEPRTLALLVSGGLIWLVRRRRS